MEENRIGLVLMLLREGSTRHAIKVYQEEAHVSLFHARQRVYDLACEHGIYVRKRGIVPVLLITLAGLLGLLLSH